MRQNEFAYGDGLVKYSLTNLNDPLKMVVRIYDAYGNLVTNKEIGKHLKWSCWLCSKIGRLFTWALMGKPRNHPIHTSFNPTLRRNDTYSDVYLLAPNPRRNECKSAKGDRLEQYPDGFWQVPIPGVAKCFSNLTMETPGTNVAAFRSRLHQERSICSEWRIFAQRDTKPISV